MTPADIEFAIEAADSAFAAIAARRADLKPSAALMAMAAARAEAHAEPVA